jgi:drug/metabolite transporter (DMT)-like permease
VSAAPAGRRTWVAIALAFAGVLLLAGERGAAGDYLA